ncbi:MAG: class I mannose-6-phosphate isomerase [Verrucomicrobia bacterium]|nr:class I mannose-6-phosphate isomerase [Verrucomicrobiota bacterium]
MQSVFKFHPIYKERPWGGRAIARVGDWRSLPPNVKIGESWEIVDREDDMSVIAEGEFLECSLRRLLDAHGSFVMGVSWKKGRRFPLLVKLLDATERMSLQVHPTPAAARELGGEPKTEIWRLVAATAEASVLAGLKKGVRREDFERRLRSQSISGAGTAEGSDLEPLIHRVPVKKGDAMLVPSGRLHAIGAGCLILEIQQNSDTTYRVYDWGRVGLDGKPRELQVEQALRCVNFEDFEPSLIKHCGNADVRLLAECEPFRMEIWTLKGERRLDGRAACILHVLDGGANVAGAAETDVKLKRGETALLAATPHILSPIGKNAEWIVAWCRV